MDLFLAQTDVTLAVPLIDGSGNSIGSPLPVSRIEVRVVDQDGVECLARQMLPGFSENAPVATVMVPAACNQLPDGAIRGLRLIELFCTVGGNTVLLQGAYGIEMPEPLVAGVNSAQSVAMAEFTALLLPNIPGWERSNRDARVAALIDAWRQIGQLSFWVLTGASRSQDSLAFVPEGQFVTNVATADGQFLSNGGLDTLTPTQYGALPDRFKQALRLAQVVQADAILGGDPLDQRRREGLIAEAVGESRQAFRPGAPLNLPISRRALGYLSAFVSLSKRIGRGA